MKVSGIVLAVLAFAIPTGALSQGYVGGSAGRSYLSPKESDWQAAGAATNFDKNDVSWKIFGGLGLTPNFGIEVAYVDLGRYKATIVAPGSTGIATVKVGSWDLFATGKLPINDKFAVMGKLGIAHNQARMDFSSGGAPFLRADSGSSSKTSLAAGVGVVFSLNPNISLRFEYENFGTAGDTNNGFTNAGKSSESRPALWSLGAAYTF